MVLARLCDSLPTIVNSRRNVDNTNVIQKTEKRTQLLENIYPITPNIQFTTEDPNTDGSMLFLDTLVTTRPGNFCLQQSKENPPTEMSTYIETTSKTFLPSIV